MSWHKASSATTFSLKRIFPLIMVGLIFLFLTRFLYRHWVEVTAFEFHLKYHYLAISIVLLLGFFTLRVYCWKLILQKMGIVLPFRKCIKVSFVSMMGKYLPGKIWLVMGRVYLSGREGVPEVEAFASVVIEIVLEMVASIFFFFFFLLSALEKPLLSPTVSYSLGAVMVVGLVCLHPKVFFGAINFILARWKGEVLTTTLSYRDIMKLLVLYNFLILFQGIAFYFFVNALCYLSPTKLLGLTGSLAAAGVVGTLSVFTPSGLGVREGILAFLLSTYVISPMAVLISLLARLWVTIGEVLCALVAWRL